MKSILCASFTLALTLSLALWPVHAFAAEAGNVHGTITDPLGAVVPNAHVELLQDKKLVNSNTTDGQGRYEFSNVPAGHYRVRAAAPTFAP